MSQTRVGANAAAARDFAQADAAERAGDLVAAEDIFQSLLRRYPDEPALLGRLGLVVKGRGRPAEAEPLLRRAVALVPSEPSLHNNLGNVLRQQGQLPEAIACYDRAIALSPGYAEPHFNKGLVLEEQGQVAAAVESVSAAVRLRPAYHQALTRLAALAYQQGQPETALTHADAALALKGDFFDAHYYRGLTLSALERYDEALQALERARALRPESFEAALAIANNLQKCERNDEAVDAFWALMERKPERVATHEDLNRLAWATGRRDLFLKSFVYAREREGEKPDLLRAEAELRLRREENEAAEALLRRARGLAPGEVAIAASLARALARQGKFEECFALLEQATRAEPGNMLYRNDYGLALLTAGDARRALQLFEQSCVVAPENQLAAAGLCLALRETGDSRYFDLVDFETYVRTYDIAAPKGFADARSFNAALAEELAKLHTLKVEPIEQTLRGGTQTSGFLFNRSASLIQAVKAQIEEAIADYIRRLPRDPSHPTALRNRGEFSFTHSWSCKLRSEGYHTNHVHPMGWISSAYYVDVPEELHDAATRAGWLKFGESNMKLGANDRAENAVMPVVGRLVLFPSFYWHGTVPFSSGRDRLTIAFDVVPGAQAAIDSRGPY